MNDHMVKATELLLLWNAFSGKHDERVIYQDIRDNELYASKQFIRSSIHFCCGLILYIHAPVRTSYVHVRVCVALYHTSTYILTYG